MRKIDINIINNNSNFCYEDFGAPDKPCGEDARMLTQNCR